MSGTPTARMMEYLGAGRRTTSTEAGRVRSGSRGRGRSTTPRTVSTRAVLNHWGVFAPGTGLPTSCVPDDGDDAGDGGTDAAGRCGRRPGRRCGRGRRPGRCRGSDGDDVVLAGGCGRHRASTYRRTTSRIQDVVDIHWPGGDDDTLGCGCSVPGRSRSAGASVVWTLAILVAVRTATSHSRPQDSLTRKEERMASMVGGARFSMVFLAAVWLVALVAAGCGDDGGSTQGTRRPRRATRASGWCSPAHLRGTQLLRPRRPRAVHDHGSHSAGARDAFGERPGPTLHSGDGLPRSRRFHLERQRRRTGVQRSDGDDQRRRIDHARRTRLVHDGRESAAHELGRLRWTTDLQIEAAVPIEAYVDQRVQVITGYGMAYIATSKGSSRFDADVAQYDPGDAGHPWIRWRFDTEMPLGNSPTSGRRRLRRRLRPESVRSGRPHRRAAVDLLRG